MPPPQQNNDNVNPISAASAEEQYAGTEDFRKRMTDEYKILQDKIDKIGGFRFTIKGWSITAVIAATAAASTSKSVLTAAVVSLGLAAMLLFFFFFEVEQVRLSWLFGNRARRLEDAFIRIDRPGSKLHRPFPVPYTANEVVIASRDAQRRSSDSRPRKALWRGAHVYFYVILLFLAFMPLVPRYTQIGRYLSQWAAAAHSVIQGNSKPGPTGK